MIVRERGSRCDLGGTAINYTLINGEEKFLIEGLCEHPARSKEGPEICLQQIADGLEIAVRQVGLAVEDVVVVGLDTPGPASASGVLSAKGSTNFVHADWAGFDIRDGLARKLGKPVTYLNDGNAARCGAISPSSAPTTRPPRSPPSSARVWAAA